MTLSPLGDSAVVITLGAGFDPAVLPRVRALAAALAHEPIAGVVDIVPAFAAVTVFYDIVRIGSYAQLCADLEQRATRVSTAQRLAAARSLDIPVCYGGNDGPDLAELAARAALSISDVVALHHGADYLVQAVGFVPGFAYLGGLPTPLHTPRRPKPRVQVPAGSVGIGGGHTGVYPFVTPGGWNLIGRTPLALFDATRATPALLRVGDRVTFRAISTEEFAAWR